MAHQKSNKFQIDTELYASQEKRFANFILDYIFTTAIAIVFVFLIAIIASLSGNDKIILVFNNLTLVQRLTFGSLVLLVYYNFCEMLFSQTFGKLVTNTIVVNENGEKPESNEILIRSICRLIPLEQFSFLFYQNSGWHDLFSKTYVVKKDLLLQKKRAFAETNSNIPNL